MLSEKLLNECEKFLNKDQILDKNKAQEFYGNNTINHIVSIAGAFIIKNKDEIIELLKIANQYKIALYPISTGKNWGYGGSTPVTDNCYILDLSNMNKIIDFDPISGVVTLEPGVTQGMLSEFLQQNNYDFMVPTTGAGPNCSLLGNALERGFGIAPNIDHFAAVTSIEVVLASGEVLRRVLAEKSCEQINRIYKWGLGPYLDGIFSQSNFGIVTTMSIKLLKSQNVVIFIMPLTEAEMLNVIPIVADLKECLGSAISRLDIANAYNLASISADFSLFNDKLERESEKIQQLIKKNKISEWTMVGCLYGPEDIINASKKIVKQRLAKVLKKRIFFLSEANIKWIQKITKNNKIFSRIFIIKKILDFAEAMSLYSGNPTNAALKTPYWTKNNFPRNNNINPDKDNCGLIWYAPLVKCDMTNVKDLIKTSTDIFNKHQCLPIMRLVLQNSGCFDCTMPILFNKDELESIKRAENCFNELIELNSLNGNFPYRMPVSKMNSLKTENSVYWDTIKKIKSVLDPNNIISPGRYEI